MRPETKSATADLSGALEQSLAAMSLPLPAQARRQLLDYVGLIAKWNRVYNLTAIRDPQQMLVQHVVDSLSIVAPLRELNGPRADEGDQAGSAQARPLVVDVGSGAGLPGIPLAIAWPALHVTMVEPVGKKAAFIQHAIGALKLTESASVAQCRVEALRQSPLLTQTGSASHPLKDRAPDVIVSRAFASLADFVRAVEPLMAPTTRIAAMKGVLPADEIAELPAGWRVDATPTLTVPGLNAQRHLILLSRSA